MKLYDVTYYSTAEDGYLIPERTWIIQANDDEDVLNKCAELSKKVSSGIFMSQVIYTIDFAGFTEEFVLEEIKDL